MPCPFCGSSDGFDRAAYANSGAHRHTSFEGLELLGCRSCRSAWVETPPGDVALIDYYSTSYRPGRMAPVQEDKWPHSDTRVLSLLTLARLFYEVRPGDLFVDVGPGNGSALSVAPYLLSSPRRACIEFNAESIAYFRRHAPDIVVAPDVATLISTFGEGSAALIYSAHCYEHFTPAGLAQHLEEIRRLIRPDGALVVEVPFAEFGKIARADFHTPHLLFFSKDGFAATLRRAGFEPRLCVDVVGRVVSRPHLDALFKEEPEAKKLQNVFRALNAGDFIHRDVDPSEAHGFVLKCVATPA